MIEIFSETSEQFGLFQAIYSSGVLYHTKTGGERKVTELYYNTKDPIAEVPFILKLLHLYLGEVVVQYTHHNA